MGGRMGSAVHEAPRAEGVPQNGGMTPLLALGSRISDVNLLAYLAAFGGGVVSFLSPCVLPLVPGYLSIVTGLDLTTLEDDSRVLTRVS